MPMKRYQPLFSLPPMSGEVVSNTDKHEAALSLDIRIHGGRSIGEVSAKSLQPSGRPLCLRYQFKNCLYGGIAMVNIDLWGTAVMLRRLKEQGKLTDKEAKQILSRIAVETGADLIISF